MLKVNLRKIKLLRKKRMSLEEMSLKLGYGSPNGYYYLESGRSKIPADILAKVSMILEVPIQDLFYDDEKADQK